MSNSIINKALLSAVTIVALTAINVAYAGQPTGVLECTGTADDDTGVLQAKLNLNFNSNIANLTIVEPDQDLITPDKYIIKPSAKTLTGTGTNVKAGGFPQKGSYTVDPDDSTKVISATGGYTYRHSHGDHYHTHVGTFNVENCVTPPESN